MPDETVQETEVSGNEVTEPTAPASEAAAPEPLDATEPEEVTAPTEVVTEPEATEAYTTVDYTPVIHDAVNALANIQLAGALLIAGVLIAFKFWEVPHK